jgi:hypothetical protein
MASCLLLPIDARQLLSRRSLFLAAPLATQLHSPAVARSSPSAPIAMLPAPSRIVACGDIHGDVTALRRVLRLSGLYDEARGWMGGDAVFVQIGDVLDRGDDEWAVLSLLRALKPLAAAQGGAVVTLLGNHEIMNAAGVTVYASQRSAAAFDDRATAFRIGGELAAELATWPVACVIGDTAFCHAGLTRKQVQEGLDRENEAASAWLLGRSQSSLPPEFLWPTSRESQSPLWMRDLSSPPMGDPGKRTCEELEQVLANLGARRLVVGHTVQPRINCACDCSVYRIDVGMSNAMGGAMPQALEISRGGVVRILTESSGHV